MLFYSLWMCRTNIILTKPAYSSILRTSSHNQVTPRGCTIKQQFPCNQDLIYIMQYYPIYFWACSSILQIESRYLHRLLKKDKPLSFHVSWSFDHLFMHYQTWSQENIQQDTTIQREEGREPNSSINFLLFVLDHVVIFLWTTISTAYFKSPDITWHTVSCFLY